MSLTPEQIEAGWIEHDGGPCPVEDDRWVDVMWKRLPDDYTSHSVARVFGWNAVRAYRPEPKP